MGFLDKFPTSTCIYCGKEFKLTSSLRKYCSHNCYYQKNKNKIIKRVVKWQKKNPEKVRKANKKGIQKFVDDGRMKKFMRKYYLKNKKKWMSRSITYKIVYHKGSYKKIILEKDFFKCKKCGTKRDLQIHHKIYPTKKEEILKAIKSGTIYILCKKCHRTI